MTREEAIERIKSRYDKWALDDKDLEAIQCIFSGPKEDEDERIRKWLISYFEKVNNEIVEEDRRKIITYLERQKDASKAIEAVDRIDKYIDEHVANAHDMNDSNPDKKYYQGWDDALGKVAGILQDVYSNEKQKEQRDYNKLYKDIGKSEWFKKSYEGKSLGCDYEQNLSESISQLTVQGKGVYKICPRCKACMIRDDSKVYTSIPPKYGYECPKCGEMAFDTVIYDSPEMEELKPAEWSEDDETRLKVIKEELEKYIMFKQYGTPLSVDDIGWLESLPERFHPQAHWRPSEEQMRWLESAVKLSTDKPHIHGIIISLYEQLKRL